MFSLFEEDTQQAVTYMVAGYFIYTRKYEEAVPQNLLFKVDIIIWS
jgi:hypothetical protein